MTTKEVAVLMDHMQKNLSNNAGNELISSTYKSNISTQNKASNALDERGLR